MDGLSLRLPVILTKGKILQDRSWNVRFHGGKSGNKQSGEHIVTATLSWSKFKFT